MMLTSARWGLVLAVMLVFCRRQIAEGWPLVRKQWLAVLLMGASGFTGFNALNYVAAHFTSAINISIMQGTIPVAVLIAGLLLHRTPIRAGQAAGVAVALAGVAMVASGGHWETLARLRFNFGDLLMLAACMLYAAYTLGLRSKGPSGSGALGFFFGMAVAAFLTSLPLLAVEVAGPGFEAPTLKGWAILTFIALIPSFMSAVFFMRAVQLIGPARAGLFVNLVPVFGAILAVVILGEPLGLHQVIALVLVLGGIALSERKAGARAVVA
jgi:drug/metabolite transporter (DMT)-like permease